MAQYSIRKIFFLEILFLNETAWKLHIRIWQPDTKPPQIGKSCIDERSCIHALVLLSSLHIAILLARCRKCTHLNSAQRNSYCISIQPTYKYTHNHMRLVNLCWHNFCLVEHHFFVLFTFLCFYPQAHTYVIVVVYWCRVRFAVFPSAPT